MLVERCQMGTTKRQKGAGDNQNKIQAMRKQHPLDDSVYRHLASWTDGVQLPPNAEILVCKLCDQFNSLQAKIEKHSGNGHLVSGYIADQEIIISEIQKTYTIHGKAKQTKTNAQRNARRRD